MTQAAGNDEMLWSQALGLVTAAICRYMNLGYEASISKGHLALGRGDYDIVGTWVSAEIGCMECEGNSQVDDQPLETTKYEVSCVVRLTTQQLKSCTMLHLLVHVPWTCTPAVLRITRKFP